MSSTISPAHSNGADVKPTSTRTRRKMPDQRFVAPSVVDNDVVPGTPQRESRMNSIAIRAHEIYEARGGQDGAALADWLQAEREVDAIVATS